MIKDNIFSPLNILNFSSFLQYQRFIMPISYLFYLHNGLTFSDFILFQSIFNITCLAAKIPMGFFGDIFPRKYLIILSYSMFTLRVLLWILFNGFWVILAGEILYGLFKALYRGNVDSYIYDLLKQNSKEKQMLHKYGSLTLYTSLGSAISCFAGVIMYKYIGYKSILITELFFQLMALGLLCFIPNIKVQNAECKVKDEMSNIKNKLLDIIKNNNIRYYVYYSSVLIGLTSVLVWNFQPLLKSSNAPIILFGAASFINQIFRALGGYFANKIVFKYEKSLIGIEYFCVTLSLIMLITANYLKIYIFSFFAVFILSIAICLFVVFNIYTVSKIHTACQSSARATTSSVNTFIGDFTAFLFLLAFKFLYDIFDLNIALFIFTIIVLVLLYPGFKKFLYKTV